MGQAQINVRTRACSRTSIARTKQAALTHNVRGKCGSCPADVATAARPRTATHDHGRFYSFINKISFHGSRRFIFTGSCSVYIIMRQLSRAKPGNPASNIKIPLLSFQSL